MCPNLCTSEFETKHNQIVRILSKNSDGHIITDPQLALDEINHQWDSIFGANALHTDPHEILRVIWPSIQRIRSPTDVPPLDGQV